MRINIFTSESLKRLIHSASRMGILRALYQHSSLALIRHKAGKLLNPLFPNNPVWLTIEGGILAGSDICADLRHGEKSYWLGTFEMEVQSAIQRLATQSPHLKCIYDIGAHVGYFSMMLARCFQRAHIFAFEPNPSNYERLALNIQRNRLTCEVTPVHRAVCDQVGELPFYVGESSWSGSLHREHRESSRLQYTVSTTTLDEIVFQDHYPPPDLMKIDVEGAEVQVLRGGIGVLRKYKPTLILEIHYARTAEEVSAILRQIDYSLDTLTEGKDIGTSLYSGHVVARHT